MTGPVGRSPLRSEDARLLLGRANHVDNVHLDRMAHGVFIRSPYPHAEIVSIDGSAALAAGALAVLTARDLPFNDRPFVVRYWNPAIRNGMPQFLASERVRFVGDPVAFLVAEDRYLAEDLAALVDVDYRELPPLATTEAALAADAPTLHAEWTGNVAAEFGLGEGDTDAALARSAHRVRHRFRFGRQAPLPLEPRGAVADFDAERGRLTARVSTQAHYNVRENLAQLLDVPEYQVRVVAEDVGGGFGSKSRTFPEEIVVSHASRLLRRPVKWIEDRLENFHATTHSRDIEAEIEIGCDGDGRFTGLRADLVLDVGGYVHTSGIITAEVAAFCLGAGYLLPHRTIGVRCVGTSKTPIATYRGAGAPEAAFAMERAVELLAREAGLSPLEMRRRNAVAPEDYPHAIGAGALGGGHSLESGDLPAMIERAVAESGYTEAVETAPDGRRVAWSLVPVVEAAGVVNFESALVRAGPDGRIAVLSGMSGQGQGQPTTYAQVCAETLGVPLEHVSVRIGDTDLVPFGRGAFASRGAIFGANAVHGAAEKLRGIVLERAATLLQCETSELDLRLGAVVRRDGGETGLAVADVARAVAPGGPLFDGAAALEAHHVFDNGGQAVTFGFSVHAARLELDPRTGFYRLLDYFVLHDAGRALNPTIVEGQVVGGVVDGIGGAMLSEIAYDESAQLLTGSLADYLVATAPDMPRIRVAHMNTPAGTNPLGVRGIGEGGAIPPAALVANALSRAIASIGPVREDLLSSAPLKPERVHAACRAAADGPVAAD